MRTTLPACALRVAQISDALPNAQVTAVQQAVKARSMTLARVGRFGAALAMVVLVVGALLVFVTVTSSVTERRREIGVLRAVGFRRSHILCILGIEIAAYQLVANALEPVGARVGFAFLQDLLVQFLDLVFLLLFLPLG